MTTIKLNSRDQSIRLINKPGSTITMREVHRDIKLSATVRGPQGPAGQDGVDGVDGQDGADGTGDLTFTQPFGVTSSVTVNHNLGKFPSVTVIDSAGDEVEGAVDHLNANSLTVTFAAPFSGVVYLN